MTSLNQNENNILHANISLSKDQFIPQASNTQGRAFGRELTNFGRKGDGLQDNIKFNNLKPNKNNLALKSSVSSDSNCTKMNIEYVKPSEAKENSMKVEGIKNYMEKITGNDDQQQQQGEEIDPVDMEELNNPQYVVEYAKEIFEYLRSEEDKYLPKPHYMIKVQNDINEKMRGILVDWLVDVHLKFKLLPETLYLTINLIDRYLSQVAVMRQKLQLVGVSAMLIASKYEEIYPPEVKDFEYVTDKAYTREEILEMEGKMLHTLNFNLTTTSSYRFMERFARIGRLDERSTQMTRYLLELGLTEFKMIKYLPSNLACSAIYLVNKLEKREGWSDAMAKQTSYSEPQLRACARDLCLLLQNVGKSSLQAVKRKFSSSKFLEVAKIQWNN